MKNASCRELYEYWNRLRGSEQAPHRDAVEPADIRRVLGDTFILEAAGLDSYPYRLAGTRLCGAYCREVKGTNFLDFWSANDREAIATLLAAVGEDGAAAVVGVSGHASGTRTVPFEMLLLPLVHQGAGFDRMLGCMAPMDRPYWLGTDPVVSQEIVSLRLIWPDEEPSFLRRLTPRDRVPLRAIVPADAQTRRNQFVVVDGGKR